MGNTVKILQYYIISLLLSYIYMWLYVMYMYIIMYTVYVAFCLLLEVIPISEDIVISVLIWYTQYKYTNYDE